MPGQTQRISNYQNILFCHTSSHGENVQIFIATRTIQRPKLKVKSALEDELRAARQIGL